MPMFDVPQVPKHDVTFEHVEGRNVTMTSYTRHL
jgi:hypothetical protein